VFRNYSIIVKRRGWEKLEKAVRSQLSAFSCQLSVISFLGCFRDFRLRAKEYLVTGSRGGFITMI
jgi:UDP-2,3-diacylglucosamine pyrophosphatase LpxH